MIPRWQEAEILAGLLLLRGHGWEPVEIGAEGEFAPVPDPLDGEFLLDEIENLGIAEIVFNHAASQRRATAWVVLDVGRGETWANWESGLDLLDLIAAVEDRTSPWRALAAKLATMTCQCEHPDCANCAVTEAVQTLLLVRPEPPEPREDAHDVSRLYDPEGEAPPFCGRCMSAHFEGCPED